MSHTPPIMNGEHHRRVEFSPLLVGILGIVAGAIMVAAYHCVIANCYYRRQTQSPPNGRQSLENNTEGTSYTGNSTSTSIAVMNYSKECDGGMCSVCLSEFNDGEQIRVLPECLHLFHATCIDMWLNSHSNCPLCRANVMPPQHLVLLMPDSGRIRPQESHQVTDFGG